MDPDSLVLSPVVPRSGDGATPSVPPADGGAFWHPQALVDVPVVIEKVLVGTHMPMATRIIDPARPPRAPGEVVELSPAEEAMIPFARRFTRSFEERLRLVFGNVGYDTASQTYRADGLQILCDGGGGGGNYCPQTYYSLTDSGNCNFKDDENDGPNIDMVPD